MSVHYKFKSGKDAHTITFDSIHISVGELKKAIMQQRKIGKSADLDLQITNAQTKEVYDSDTVLIPKNTSVIVARVPVANAKKNWNKNDGKNNDTSTYQKVEEKVVKSVKSDGSEDDKIKEMLTQSTKDYDPSKYARGKGPMGPLPPNYTCYRCGKPGHYIKHCPTNNIDVKRSTGIPRSFMIPAKADTKGAMITASGEYAVPIIDHDAYKEIKKEKPPFFSTENEPELPKIEIPDDLKCSLCQNLLQDAVLIPCCGNSYCDECIRLLLLESDNHECPSCKETNVAPDTLIPNRYLRLSVAKFKNETGFGVCPTAVDEKKEKKDEEKSATEVNSEESGAKKPEEAATAGGNDTDTKDVDLDEVFKSEIDAKEADEEKADEAKVEAKSEDSSEKNVENMIPSVVPTIDHSNFQSQALLNSSLIAMNNYNNGRYRNHIRVRSSGGQPLTMYGRMQNPLLLPRNNFNRPLLPHDPAFLDLQGFSAAGLALPYGYNQNRNPLYNNMYSLSSRGQINPLLSYPNNLNSIPSGSLNGMAPIDGDNQYYAYKYDDYDDKVERFNRQLESGSRSRYRRKHSRSRSRSPHSNRSRSRSVSSCRSSHSGSRSPSKSSRKHSAHTHTYSHPSRYSRRERSHSRSSHHRYHKSSSSSYSRHRRSHSRHDKRASRSRERSERDKKYKHSSKREKESVEPREKSTVDSNRNEDKPSEQIEPENNPLDSKQPKDLPTDDEVGKVCQQGGASETTDVALAESTDEMESRSEQQQPKPTAIKEDKEKDSKENRSERPRSKRRSHSRSKSVSNLSDDDFSARELKPKRKSKKSSKESKSKHSSSNRDGNSKSKSKSGSKAKDKTKKFYSESKHSKDKDDGRKRKHESKRSETKSSKGNSLDDSAIDQSIAAPAAAAAAPAPEPIESAVSQPDKLDSLHSGSENCEMTSTANKSDDVEIKIQEDYSDFEFVEGKEYSRNESRDDEKCENGVEKVSSEDKAKDSKEETKSVISKSSGKSGDKPLLSFTIERKTKISSKLTFKDEEEKKKDKSGKERSGRTKGERKASKDRHKDQSSHSSSHKGDSSKSSKSKEKKKDHSSSHRSSKRSRKSRSRSSSLSSPPPPAHKKLKSEIDSSYKHKSSRSHRK